MSDKTMRRRDILNGAAGATIATALAANAATNANAQGTVAPALTARPADIVLRNGKIITVDRAFSIADSIAIAGDRVVAVGPNAAMASVTSPTTRIVDLKGRAVIPGLVDSHAHMDREGLKDVFPSLGRVRSTRDIQDRIRGLDLKTAA